MYKTLDNFKLIVTFNNKKSSSINELLFLNKLLMSPTRHVDERRVICESCEEEH